MEYLTAHAGYTRVHNPVTGEKDLVRLPGLVAVAYQHETSRCGDPHLHTHVIVPNRQARADGVMVSIDGTSLYHEAKAAGVIYQATLRRELHQSLGVEWAPVDPSTGMAELAGVDRDTITAWSRRSTQLRDWAAHNLHVVDGPLTAAQLAAAQKATRPPNPKSSPGPQLVEQWRADARGLRLDRAAFDAARAARRAAARTAVRPRAHRWPRPADRQGGVHPRRPGGDPRRATARSTPSAPRAQLVEAAVDEIGDAADRAARRASARRPRALHPRPDPGRGTAMLDLVDARDDRAVLWSDDKDTAGLSPIRSGPWRTSRRSPWLVQPLSAPAGAGKTTSLRALRAAAHRRYAHVLVLAPTGKRSTSRIREGAGDHGYTIAKALHCWRDDRLALGAAHPGRGR